MERRDANPTRPPGESGEEPPTQPPLPPPSESPPEAEIGSAAGARAGGDTTPQPDETQAAEELGSDDVDRLLDPTDSEMLFPRTLVKETDEGKDWSVMSSALVRKLHWGLEKGTQKWAMARLLDSQLVECIILALVLCDLALVSIEVGIYHHYICINGRLVPETPELRSTWEAYPAYKPGDDIIVRGHESLAVSAANSLDRAAPLRAPSLLQSAMSAERLLFTSGANHAVRNVRAEDASPAHCALGACAANSRILSMDGYRWRVEANSSEVGNLDQRFLARLRGLIRKAPSPDGSGSKMILICEDRTASMAHAVMLACDFFSVAILVAFLAELLLKMWVHPQFFKNSMLHMLDLLVVSMSLAADVFGILLYYWYVGSWDVKFLEVVFVVLRLWRILRIFHTAFSMWYRSTGHLKMAIKLQKERLRKGKETVTMLRTLTGLQGVALADLRNMERNMHDMDREIMKPVRPGFIKDQS